MYMNSLDINAKLKYSICWKLQVYRSSLSIIYGMVILGNVTSNMIKYFFLMAYKHM